MTADIARVPDTLRRVRHLLAAPAAAVLGAVSALAVLSMVLLLAADAPTGRVVTAAAVGASAIAGMVAAVVTAISNQAEE